METRREGEKQERRGRKRGKGWEAGRKCKTKKKIIIKKPQDFSFILSMPFCKARVVL